MDNQIPEEPEDSSIEHDLSLELETSNPRTAVAYGLYSQIKGHKDYFSRAQGRYRALVSTWIIAAFIGLGYVLSKKEAGSVPISPMIQAAFLSLGAVLGIGLLWHLDIVLHQKLWWASVAELASIEEKYSFITRVNSNILLTHRDRRFCWMQSIIYIGSIIAFIFIATLCLAVNFYMSGSNTLFWIVIIFGVVISALLPFWMIKQSGELNKYDSHSFHPEDN